MATHYWRGAIDSNVQNVGNWSLIAPGTTMTPPPPGVTLPGVGDTVIFVDHIEGNWNPVFGPVGLIGNGITHAALHQAIVSQRFLRNMGLPTNFLKIHANLVIFNSGQTTYNYIKSLKSSCSMSISPSLDLPNNAGPKYFIAGAANTLTFNAPAGYYRSDVLLGMIGFPGFENGSIAIGISGGLIMNNAPALHGKLYIGQQSTLGGLNIIRGNGLQTRVQPGVSMENLHIYGSPAQSAMEANSCWFWYDGISLGEPSYSKTYIRNFSAGYGSPLLQNGGYAANPYIDCSGVCFDNFMIRDFTDVLLRPGLGDASQYNFIRNFTMHINPQYPSGGLWFPFVRGDNSSVVIGGPLETGGGSIVNPLGISYDLPASILINGTYTLDIV